MIDLVGFSFDMEEDDSEKVKIKESSLQDIAVIGMSVCLPGADHIDQFWRSLAEGEDLVVPFPEERKRDLRDYAERIGLDLDHTDFFKGAYLPEIDKFDYPFFRLSPREAGLMNPNQRLFLETAWKTIEDAGYGGGQLKGTKAGIFLGYCADAFHDYKKLIENLDPTGVSMAVPGNLSSVIAGRISYLLDLKGPAITVDTACSSSLVAIHLACQALRSGDCDTALAGSVKTLVFPADTGIRIGIESSDGRAKSFDHGSDGTGMGEGTAAVMLKPLARAILDGDSIYAVIKGSAVNQDGSSIGLSAPNVAAQEEVIADAWMNAGIDPETISYIEAHGTGTKLGDPIEIEGIHRAFRRFTSRKQFCAVGSVKSNLGHLDNAAGVVGFVKACLALKHNQLPPSLHFNRPNASIDFIESAVYVNRRLKHWEDEGHPRRCGVSSFGLSGTNCHVVLEEAPVLEGTHDTMMFTNRPGPNSNDSEQYLFTLSTQSLSSLSELVNAYADMLSDDDRHWNIRDLCYTASLGRSHFSYRLAFVVKNVDEVMEHLRRLQLNSELLSSLTACNPETTSRKNECWDELSLQEVRDLYILGADIPWSLLYRSGTYRRVHLPSYPFDKHRCWVENNSPPIRPIMAPLGEGTEQAVTSIRKANLTGRAEGHYSHTEQLIGNVWGHILGFTEINIHDHFYSLGGDSILAYQVAVKLAEHIGKPVEAVDILRCETIAQLAAHLDQQVEQRPSNGTASITKDRYPLTSSQLRIFIQEQTGGIGTSYNMPLAFRVRGKVDHAAMERALQQLINRHEALRTTFAMEKGVPVQIVRDRAELELERYKSGNDGVSDIITRFIRPFDLNAAPLFRAGLITINPDVEVNEQEQHEHVLMIDSHHLVSDGFSTAILVKQFFELYQGKNLIPPVFQYREYVEWREQFDNSDVMVKQESFWINQLEQMGSPLRLPLDHHRPKVNTFAGRQIGFRIEKSTSQRIRQAAAANHTTPNVMLTSLYGLTILKYADQQEAVVGSIVSGRGRPGQENGVGMFINFVPLRFRAESNWTLQQYIESAKYHMTVCYENQDVPFERMVELYNRPVDRSRNPIYDTMLVFHNEYRMTGSDQMRVDGLQFEQMELPIDTATLDIKLDVFLTQEGELDCKLNYNVDIFQERTMLRFIDDFQRVIAGFLEEPQQPVGNIRLFDEQEEAELAERRKLNDGVKDFLSKEIVVNATFTSEPIEGHLQWWMHQFNIPASVRFGGYNQVFQQLLNPSDPLEGGNGCRVVLIRFEDLIGGAEAARNLVYTELERHFTELLGLVQAADKSVPYLFGIFPTSTHLGYPDSLLRYLDQLYERWKQALESIDQVYTVDFRAARRNYSVTEVFDPITDRAGHMPFSEEFYAVMGTLLARKAIAMDAAPFKVIALDCDNTLWQGVCGEDGPLGVKIETPHLLLQKWMLDRAQEGQLLTICSKNNEADVWEVFEQNPNMLLKKEHFAHWKINWLPKSDNLKQMAKELNLGIDSFVFIDDNPLECSEVMQNAPDVLTLRLPAEIRYMEKFLSHIWAWDRMTITEEDRMRTQLYAAERHRRMNREASVATLDDYLYGLGLRMSMRTMDDAEVVRASQLMMRTNQFNLNGIRLTEDALNGRRSQNDCWCWVVEASDRFGDYGIVGVVLASSDEDLLQVDGFLLSCRVLGRGIEDAVMSQLKQIAEANGLHGIVPDYRKTDKNDPFLSFLQRVGWDNEKNDVIRLDQISDCPGFVELYFESLFERQQNEAVSLPEYFVPASDSATPTEQTAADTTTTVAKMDVWNPEIHWLPSGDIPHHVRHQAYMKVISCSRADLLLNIAVSKDTGLQSIPVNRKPFEAPSTPTERRLAQIWTEMLGESPGRYDHFFEIGGNSLKAASLVSKVHQVFGVELSIGDMFAEPSLYELAQMIDSSEASGFETIELCEARDYYPVLSAQKRLFLLHEIQGNQDGYNMPGVLLLEGQADIERMEAALQSVISRHESLRTSFTWVDGEIVQKIHSDMKFNLELHNQVPDNNVDSLIQAFVRPFRLSEPPLLRAGFITSVSGKQMVLIDMHHIISDGVSIGNLIEDFARAYRGEVLPPLQLQVKDYAVWQKNRLESGGMEETRRFWLNSYSTPVPKLSMTAVQERRSPDQNEGALLSFRGDSDLRRKLADYASEKGATLFMVLISAYYVLLSKYSGQEDIVIGTPAAGRIRPELEPLIGMFVNTLALRSYPARDKTIDEYVVENRDLILKALRHQEYPFELLVQELDISLQRGQNPLFDTMFVMQNMDPFRYEFEDAVLSEYFFDFGVSRFDLTMQVRELNDELNFTLEYRTHLFRKEMMEQLCLHYIRILEQIASDPEARLQDIRILGDEERTSAVERIRTNPMMEFAEFDF